MTATATLTPTIQQTNKAIALFMELTYDERTNTFHDGSRKLLPKELKYHLSWNWIMPVIEKIQDMYGDNVEFKKRINNGYHAGVLKYCAFLSIENYKEIFIRSSNSDIETVHNVVHQFIEWYNNNKS